MTTAAEESRYLSQSRAKEEYLLSDAMLGKLNFRAVRNPSGSTRSDMKLFLAEEVKALAIEVWGGDYTATIAKERVKRREQRRQREVARKARKSNVDVLLQKETPVMETGSRRLREEIKRLRGEEEGEVVRREEEVKALKKRKGFAEIHSHVFDVGEEKGLLRCIVCGKNLPAIN